MFTGHAFIDLCVPHHKERSADKPWLCLCHFITHRLIFQIVAGSRGKTAPIGVTFGSPSLDAVASGKMLHDLMAFMISGVICTMGILSVEEPDKMSEMAGVSTALIQRDFPSGIV